MNFKQSLIDNNSVLINAKANTWQEAIKLGTDALIKANVVEPQYYDAIISAVSTQGPYICIHDNFALPHCRPEDGVIKTGFAMTVLEKGVMFEGMDEPVDVLVTLAGKDMDEHIIGTMQVANLIEFDEDFSKVRACQNSDELLTLIQLAQDSAQ